MFGQLSQKNGVQSIGILKHRLDHWIAVAGPDDVRLESGLGHFSAQQNQGKGALDYVVIGSFGMKYNMTTFP